MITIFNNKINARINIEDSEWVQFMPREYEEIPNVLIELKNGFDFLRHSKKCEECSQFVNAFGSKTLDWYISYNGHTKRLDLSTLNSKEYFNNQIKFTNSYFDYGTKIKLIIHPLSTDKEEIEQYLQELLSNEDYETACLIRDL